MANNYYKQGQDRNQQLMFPTSLDEYVDENNSVRAIDAYVEVLDLATLNFKNTRKSSRSDGQKAYSPKLLLKIYIYGYLNKIRSSRALEKECKRNIELMWMCAGLIPSYHTISDFRKDNPDGLKQVFKEFVILCRNVDLIGDGLKAVDGAFLRANASKNRLIVKTTLIKELKSINKDIDEYFKVLDYSDKEQQTLNLLSKLPKDLRVLKYKQKEVQEDLQLLEQKDKNQYNKTDKDANLMIKPAHNLMAYNSQIVVDESYKFIVATDVMTNPSDKLNLYVMAKQTKDILEVNKLDIAADTGYASHKELKRCVDDNINAYVPLANIQQVQKDKGFYSQDDFKYDKTTDVYICPNNQCLINRDSQRIKSEKIEHLYSITSKICNTCTLKEKCLSKKATSKKIYRWEYEGDIDIHKQKMKTQYAKEISKKRSALAEHPFGTIKRTLGWDHFLVRGIKKVSGENALIMFTYNFRRLLNLIGIALFKKLLITLQSKDEKELERIKQEIQEYILLYYLFFTHNFMLFRKSNNKKINI